MSRIRGVARDFLHNDRGRSFILGIRHMEFISTSLFTKRATKAFIHLTWRRRWQRRDGYSELHNTHVVHKYVGSGRLDAASEFIGVSVGFFSHVARSGAELPIPSSVGLKDAGCVIFCLDRKEHKFEIIKVSIQLMLSVQDFHFGALCNDPLDGSCIYLFFFFERSPCALTANVCFLSLSLLDSKIYQDGLPSAFIH